MKIEIEASWRELLCIAGAVVLCVTAFVWGAYKGAESMNQAAVDIDENMVGAAAGLHMEAMDD